MPKTPALLAASIASLLVAAPVYAAATAETASATLITPEERQAHEEQMRSMTPEQRDTYRNEQYELLKERARIHGVELPATPPWQAEEQAAQAAAPATVGPGPAGVSPAAAQATNAGPGPAVSPAPEAAETANVGPGPAAASPGGPATPAPTQEEMARRLEAWQAKHVQEMTAKKEEAEARRADMGKQADARRAETQARMPERSAAPTSVDISERHAEIQKQAEARRAEMEKQAEARRAEAQARMAERPAAPADRKSVV